MSIYALESFGQSVYDKIEPLTRVDSSNNFALAHYVASLSRMLQDIDDLVGEHGGRKSWELLFDANNIPAIGLGWLGQFVGVSIPRGLDVLSQRARILAADGFWRGTLTAMHGAAAPFLTGTQNMLFRERDPAAAPNDPAYGLTVITRTAETPDSAAVLAALITQKPAGIILNYVVLDGQDYQLLLTNHALYSNVFADYATYRGVANDVPGG